MKRIYAVVISILILVGFLLIFVPFTHHYGAKTELRAAMDIGSGATNLKIAQVDTRNNKIISEIFEKSIPVPYQKELDKADNHLFNREIMDQGITAIKQLKSEADQRHVQKIVAVATAAFRAADNAQQFANEIEKETGIQVRIINQDEEGILAFRGALATGAYDPKTTVVWDIGGGSMQLTTLTPQGTYFIEKGETASIPFKNTVIKLVEHQDIATISTPNPLNQEEMQRAIAYAKQSASQSSTFIKEKLTSPHTHVVAVGSLFNYGIKPLVNRAQVESEPLYTAIEGMLNKTDAELNQGALSEVAVTNPIMVYGYMQALHIASVRIEKVNNTDGALTNPAYWQ